MRIIAIMIRVLKELLRDKRTLALMFLAPILILFLMNAIFSSNSTTNVTIGTVSLSQAMNKKLGKGNHVDVKLYDSKTAAEKALKKTHIDAIIQKKHNDYILTHANTDSTKTTAVKMAVKNALTARGTAELKTGLKTSTTVIGKLRHQLTITSKALAKLQFQVAKSTNQKVKTSKSNHVTLAQVSSKKMATPKITIHYVYGDANTSFFDKMLPILMGFFVFFFVFLISGMALLKERTSGTLDRLLATPVKRYEIVFGYMASYGILAIFQTVLIVLVTVWLLGAEVVGSLFSIILINLLLALVALAFGILLSTFASSEFQMMQFIPLVVIPQIFFSGIIPLDQMASWIKTISYIVPIKYSGDAVTAIMMRGAGLSSLGLEITVLFGFLIVLTFLNIVGLKRYRKV